MVCGLSMCSRNCKATSLGLNCLFSLRLPLPLFWLNTWLWLWSRGSFVQTIFPDCFLSSSAHQMAGNLPWRPSQLFIHGSPLRMAATLLTAPVIAQIAAPPLWPQMSPLLPDIPHCTKFQPSFYHVWFYYLLLEGTIICLISFLTTVIDFFLHASVLLIFSCIINSLKNMTYQICSSSLVNSAKAHTPSEDKIDPHRSQEGF